MLNDSLFDAARAGGASVNSGGQSDAQLPAFQWQPLLGAVATVQGLPWCLALTTEWFDAVFCYSTSSAHHPGLQHCCHRAATYK